MANLRQSLRNRAGIDRSDVNNRTKSTYRRGIDDYVKFCQGQGINKIRDTLDDPKAIIRNWIDNMVERGLKAATIHTYVAPVAKAYNLNMKELDKPRRKAAEVEKGRNPKKNLQGQRERWEDRYKLSVQLAEATGLRRRELMKITAGAIRHDESGALCVCIVGKGGKRQRQRILPDDVKTVMTLRRMALEANGGELDKPILNTAQFSDHIPYHTIRREHAQKAYNYFLKAVQTPEGREELRHELILRWNAEHSDKPKQDKHGNRRPSELICQTISGDYVAADPKSPAAKFLADMNGTYRLRGDNYARAMKDGRPATYDKLALLAVSVFCLAHWRNDVTVRHYML